MQKEPDLLAPVKQFCQLFLDLLFPKKCLSCGKYGSFLCAKCADTIEKIQTPTCFECGKLTVGGKYCPNCKRRTASNLAGILIASKYDEGSVRKLVFGLKYEGFKEVASILGELLAGRIGEVFHLKQLEGFVVVPVPLHRFRQNTRGFNQSELIARYISKRMCLPGGVALRRIKKTESQVGLTKIKRKENVKNAFACIDPEFVIGKKVLLVDDVVTSGATMNEAAAALKAAGAKEVWGAAAARNI